MTIFGFEELFTFHESECKQLNSFVFFMHITASAEIPVCQSFAVPVRNCPDFLSNLCTVDVLRNKVFSKSVTLVPLSTNQDPP